MKDGCDAWQKGRFLHPGSRDARGAGLGLEILAAAAMTFAVAGTACGGASGDVTQLGHDVAARPYSFGIAFRAAQMPIVFRSDRDREGIGDLYVMAADGSEIQRLTEGGDFSMPAWAPDGESVVFRLQDGVDAAVGLVTLDSGPPVLLAVGEDPSLWLRFVSWSPDGDRLQFASKRDEEQVDLWQIARSGGQRQRLLPPATGKRDAVDVSRVDGRLVFSWAPGAAPGVQHGTNATQDLWIAETPADQQPENITEGRVYSPGAPRWSPDGTRVAFDGFARLADGSVDGFGTHSEDGFSTLDTEIFIVDVGTHELTRVTDDHVDEQYPVWTPDGLHLIVARGGDDKEDGDLWRLPIDAPDEAVNLIDDDDLPSYENMPDYFWGAPTAQ